MGEKNKKPWEQRNYTFEIRADDQEEENGVGIIEGRAIVYKSKTDLGPFEEIIEPGALAKTDLTDVRFLINHNIDMVPLARSRKNNKNSTMQLIVDNEGLKIRAKLDIANNSDSRNLYSAIKRGDISGMSFMFSINGEKWEGLDTEHPTRHITDIAAVVEVSAVIFPAYEETEIGTRCKGALENARSALENARNTEKELENSYDLELEKLKIKYLYGL